VSEPSGKIQAQPWSGIIYEDRLLAYMPFGLYVALYLCHEF